ncbi:MAG: glycosyltransferase family 4 protein [Candidatus Kapaibacterium sp.]
MIRITLVSHYYPSHGGGVEIAADTLAKYLAEDNEINIHWLAADCDSIPNSKNIKYVPLRASNIIEKILPFPYPLIYPSALFRLKEFIKNTDVLHIHDFIYMSNITAFILAKLYGKKIVITQHIGFIPYNSSLLRTVLNLLNNTLGKLILLKTDKVIFISKNAEKYFRKICGDDMNSEFVPNITDNDVYYPYKFSVREQFRQELNISKFTFLFVGRFTEKKGIGIILKLAAELSECNFIFCGWGADNPAESGLPNVQVISGVTGSELVKYYNTCDALILPSYGEGFPLVVQEAVSCGLGLIVSEEIVSAYPDIEQFVKVRYSPDDDFTVFTDNVKKYVAKHQITSELRDNMHVFAFKNWNHKNITRKYKEIFNDLLSKN